MLYTLEESRKMFHCLVFMEYDSWEATILYEERNPNRARFPDYRVFARLATRVVLNGQIFPNMHNGGLRRVPLDENLERLVLVQFEESPHLSTRIVAQRLGTSHVKVWKILKINGKHPYRFQKVQKLYEGDFDPRYCF